MASTVRNYQWLSVGVLVCAGFVLVLRFLPPALPWHSEGVVIRRPSTGLTDPSGGRDLRNLAPLATVTVSSDTGRGETSEGVADGRPDANEWIAEAESARAWITLTWDQPVTVMEVDLYDRPDPSANILSGSLNFDDGSAILVHALPAGGAPERINFAPKVIRSLTFRIDQVQGRNAGLDEIMVIGTLH